MEMSLAIAAGLVILVGIIILFRRARRRSSPGEQCLNAILDGVKNDPKMEARVNALAHAIAQVRDTIKILQGALDQSRLRRGGNEEDTHYYIGYMYGVARSIATESKLNPDGTTLTYVQIEASRLCGSSKKRRGDYVEGVEILPLILQSDEAKQGINDGEADRRLVVETDPEVYYERLLRRLGDTRTTK